MGSRSAWWKTTRVFNAAGLMVSKLDRSGQGLSFTYDGTSRLVTVTDASSRTSTLTYGTAGDALGLLTRVTTADGRSVNFGYASAAGVPRLVSATDERAKTTTYAYDTGGRVVSEVDPAGHTQFTNTYDAQVGCKRKRINLATCQRLTGTTRPRRVRSRMHRAPSGSTRMRVSRWLVRPGRRGPR